jgi:hypothetical protein
MFSGQLSLKRSLLIKSGHRGPNPQLSAVCFWDSFLISLGLSISFAKWPSTLLAGLPYRTLSSATRGLPFL